ncbi:MAG TPA: hypothetical protein VGP68_17940 [Gemmataceae bacterium]|jgi:hypothetical protein|nr:hypothetical protein [Gemmataceae bacterium]
MSKLRIAASAFAVLALLAGAIVASEKIASGPQTGEEVPGPFHPMNITGDMAGQKQCLYCKNGSNPVVMIFARDVSKPLATLVKKIDAETVKHKDAKMGSFVVMLSDSEDLGKHLKDWADQEKVETCILSIDNPAGPKGYKVAKEADVTVVLYTDHKVKANYAFAKGEMKDKDVEEIVGSVSKILPQ